MKQTVLAPQTGFILVNFCGWNVQSREASQFQQAESQVFLLLCPPWILSFLFFRNRGTWCSFGLGGQQSIPKHLKAVVWVLGLRSRNHRREKKKQRQKFVLLLNTVPSTHKSMNEKETFLPWGPLRLSALPFALFTAMAFSDVLCPSGTSHTLKYSVFVFLHNQRCSAVSREL